MAGGNQKKYDCDVCKDDPLRTFGGIHASKSIDKGNVVVCPACGKTAKRY